MIGTPPKPPGSNADDAHAAIRAEADKVHRLAPFLTRIAEQWPALDALIATGLATVEGGIPASFDHKGRRYFLRVRLAYPAPLSVYCRNASELIARGRPTGALQ